MWPWRGTWKQVPQHDYSFWAQSLKPYGQSFCQEAFVLTVVHVNIPWLMYNNTIIKRMQCGRVYLKWILIVQEFDDLSCVISVELLSLCWSLVLKSTDVNLGSGSLISAHTQWTYRTDHSSIHSILISTAALIHRTGTSIYTLSHGIANLIYTNSLMISFLALSQRSKVMTKDLNHKLTHRGVKVLT